jgi:hypothetical protein
MPGDYERVRYPALTCRGMLKVVESLTNCTFALRFFEFASIVSLHGLFMVKITVLGFVGDLKRSFPPSGL